MGLSSARVVRKQVNEKSKALTALGIINGVRNRVVTAFPEKSDKLIEIRCDGVGVQKSVGKGCHQTALLALIRTGRQQVTVSVAAANIGVRDSVLLSKPLNRTQSLQRRQTKHKYP